MRALWDSDEPNGAQILRTQEEISAIQAQLGRSRVEFRLGMRDLLDAEQREQMKADRQRRGRRFHRGRSGQDGRQRKGGSRVDRGSDA